MYAIRSYYVLYWVTKLVIRYYLKPLRVRWVLLLKKLNTNRKQAGIIWCSYIIIYVSNYHNIGMDKF